MKKSLLTLLFFICTSISYAETASELSRKLTLGCMYKNMFYSSGAVVEMSGQLMQCVKLEKKALTVSTKKGEKEEEKNEYLWKKIQIDDL